MIHTRNMGSGHSYLPLKFIPLHPPRPLYKVFNHFHTLSCCISNYCKKILAFLLRSETLRNEFDRIDPGKVEWVWNENATFRNILSFFNSSRSRRNKVRPKRIPK